MANTNIHFYYGTQFIEADDSYKNIDFLSELYVYDSANQCYYLTTDTSIKQGTKYYVLKLNAKNLAFTEVTEDITSARLSSLFEKTSNGYTYTTDTEPVADKKYYIRDASKDTDIITKINGNLYYSLDSTTKTGGVYLYKDDEIYQMQSNYAKRAKIADSSNKVNSTLTIQTNGTNKGSFNGNKDVTINITPADLGLEQALRLIGQVKSTTIFSPVKIATPITTDDSSNQQYTNNVTTSGTTIELSDGTNPIVKIGDVIITSDGYEYVCIAKTDTNRTWALFGDENNYVTKDTTQVITSQKTFSGTVIIDNTSGSLFETKRVLQSTNTTDSANSTDTTAAINTAGGISVKKNLSAKTIRIDNNQTTEGCQMVYNDTNKCLEFQFI